MCIRDSYPFVVSAREWSQNNFYSHSTNLNISSLQPNNHNYIEVNYGRITNDDSNLWSWTMILEMNVLQKWLLGSLLVCFEAFSNFFLYMKNRWISYGLDEFDESKNLKIRYTKKLRSINEIFSQKYWPTFTSNFSTNEEHHWNQVSSSRYGHSMY